MGVMAREPLPLTSLFGGRKQGRGVTHVKSVPVVP